MAFLMISILTKSDYKWLRYERLLFIFKISLNQCVVIMKMPTNGVAKCRLEKVTSSSNNLVNLFQTNILFYVHRYKVIVSFKAKEKLPLGT